MTTKNLQVRYELAPQCPQLVARGRHSFICSPSDMNDLCSYLIQLGYQECTPTSKTEYARFRDRSALVVLYYSGSIITQGSEAERAAQLLRRACVEQSTLDLVWSEGGAR